jgi:hypothetical protein
MPNVDACMWPLLDIRPAEVRSNRAGERTLPYSVQGFAYRWRRRRVATALERVKDRACLVVVARIDGQPKRQP